MPVYQGPRWVRFMKKNRGRKSRDTASLNKLTCSYPTSFKVIFNLNLIGIFEPGASMQKCSPRCFHLTMIFPNGSTVVYSAMTRSRGVAPTNCPLGQCHDPQQGSGHNKLSTRPVKWPAAGEWPQQIVGCRAQLDHRCCNIVFSKWSPALSTGLLVFKVLSYRAGHAATLLRQCDHAFRPKDCWL